MLYKKICAVSLTAYAFLSSHIRGSVHYIKSNPKANIYCTDSETCHIYCNTADHGNINEYHCNSSTDCYFHCDEKKCGSGATIYGEEADNLYITEDSRGQECMKGAAIYTPDNGNGYFTTNSKKGFKEMTVFSGVNANEIIIECDSEIEDKDDCKAMNVYASSAQYLRITVGNRLDFKSATVECPAHSSYNGPDEAPCIIDATNGVMQDINIIAPDGTPKGVYIPACASCNTVRIQCDNIDVLNGFTEGNNDVYPFNTNSDCWWTNEPTKTPTNTPTKPTIDPTDAPTNAPTFPSQSPTNAPTNNPTQPTISPTTNPTNAPTIAPTFSPTKAPTFSPTKAPTFSPTKAPTFPPTKAPTFSPTKAPTHAPTVTPTKAPTFSPTKAPTLAPTFSPTKAPTLAPTLTPTKAPTLTPTKAPTLAPTKAPTFTPTKAPTLTPTLAPTLAPTTAPTLTPTTDPTFSPTFSPTSVPTQSPTQVPTYSPIKAPTQAPTQAPTKAPTVPPTQAPTNAPTLAPTLAPTVPPTNAPTLAPTHNPSVAPTSPPTNAPTMSPTLPTESPSTAPTLAPSFAPTQAPTITWSMCRQDIECEYIAQIISTITWSSADGFLDYLPTRHWFQTTILDLVLTELKDYVHVPNTLIVITKFTTTSADVEVHVGTDDKEVIDTLFTLIDGSYDMETHIYASLTETVQGEYVDSAFEVDNVSMEISLIKGSDHSKVKDKKQFPNTALDYILLIGGAFVAVLGLSICTYCIYQICVEIGERKVLRKNTDIWMPYNDEYTSAKRLKEIHVPQDPDGEYNYSQDVAQHRKPLEVAEYSDDSDFGL